jgi:peroxiredoxin Q/BCP
MAQLRQGCDEFRAREAEILVVGPEKPEAFSRYWEAHELPFRGLPDPGHTVLKLYGQEVNLFKLGRMPAQIIVDREGMVRYAHYGRSMGDIPSNAEIFGILDDLPGSGPGHSPGA